MADRYTSRISLVLDDGVDDVGALVRDAIMARDLDRAAAVRNEGIRAQEVHWGGRMQKALVRQVIDEDGTVLLRTETYLGDDGVATGMQRQARLLQALSRQLKGRVTGLIDHEAMLARDAAWMNRLAIGAVETTDAIVTAAEGEGAVWLHTHGAARFDVPDLELYGLRRAQQPAAEQVLADIHDQLLAGGLSAQLQLPDGTPVYLVPVLEAWQHVPLDWPGVGRAGAVRGEGLDGPRASLSVLHRPRFGRHRKDLKGVLALIADD